MKAEAEIQVHEDRIRAHEARLQRLEKQYDDLEDMVGSVGWAIIGTIVAATLVVTGVIWLVRP